jgi:hypothetical protein
MIASIHVYHGLEVHPLVYPRQATKPGFAHSYDAGFDAAVRIKEPDAANGEGRSRVFVVATGAPFWTSGDARRASTAYAEHLIDTCPPGRTIWDCD